MKSGVLHDKVAAVLKFNWTRQRHELFKSLSIFIGLVFLLVAPQTIRKFSLKEVNAVESLNPGPIPAPVSSTSGALHTVASVAP